jgi:hypothetical protein
MNPARMIRLLSRSLGCFVSWNSKEGNATFMIDDREITGFSNSGFVCKLEKGKATEIRCVLNLV